MRATLAVVALLGAAHFAFAADAFPPLPAALVGANQGWGADAAKVATEHETVVIPLGPGGAAADHGR